MADGIATDKINWTALEGEILHKLDLAAEYVALGGRLAGTQPNKGGWIPVHAIGREDASASAALNVASGNGTRGKYTDSAAGGQAVSLWELAVKAGRFTDWREARAHYAAKAGVTLPGAGAGGKGANSAAEMELPLKRLTMTPDVEADINRHALARGTNGGVIHAAGAIPVDHFGTPAFAFPVFQDFDRGAVGWMLRRIDWTEFPAYKSRKATKTFRWKGSGDGWNIVGIDADGNRVAGKDAVAACHTLWLCEGLPDMLALACRLPPGHAAVTCIGGAKAAASLPLAIFAGKTVYVVGDLDTAGQAGAEKFGNAACAVATLVKLVRLPGDIVPSHGPDLRDYFADGHTFDELAILADAAGAWAPAATPAGKASTGDGQAGATTITNVTYEERQTPDGGTERKAVPLSMGRIIDSVNVATAGWPRRIGNALFLHEGDGVHWFERAAAVTGYLGTKTGSPTRFHNAEGFHTAAELFAELQRTATSYTAIEMLPHEPIIDGHYYACPEVEPGDGETLHELLELFSPATPIDRDLVQAALATTIWGGPGGARPIIVITSDDGRGAGKSTMAGLFGLLTGGTIDLSTNEDMAKMKERFLSPEGLTKRVALLDNVKTLRFSWAEFEALVTALFISGKRMYIGEAQRPNTLTWIVTLNGVSLSTDMAQRSVVIKVKRPTYAGDWEEATRRFITENRMEIIADLVAFLRGKPAALHKHSRWATWERDVLARLSDPNEAQRVILERQGESDVEGEEADVIQDFFRAQLANLHYSPGSESVFIPSPILTNWYNAATGERQNVIKAGRIIRQMINEGKLPRIVDQRKESGRGVVWVGEAIDSRMIEHGDIEERIRVARELADSKRLGDLGKAMQSKQENATGSDF